MPMAGGWENVVQVIKEEYYPKLRNRLAVTVVGLIDCDEQSNRIGDVLHATPEDIRDRIFFLGVLKNPEAFKAIVKQRFEAIGEQLANECATETYEMWNHEHLRHIANEADRAKATLRPILFPIE